MCAFDLYPYLCYLCSAPTMIAIYAIGASFGGSTSLDKPLLALPHTPGLWTLICVFFRINWNGLRPRFFRPHLRLYTGSTGLAAIYYWWKGIGTSTSCPTNSPCLALGRSMNNGTDRRPSTQLKTSLGPVMTRGYVSDNALYEMGSTSSYETLGLEE